MTPRSALGYEVLVARYKLPAPSRTEARRAEAERARQLYEAAKRALDTGVSS